jgi:glycosyltransferase involved in cell wall biosynthesis/SAM-dependent methyltransferase
MTPLAERSDGIMVLRCDECGMGVLERIRDDYLSLYGDAYYGNPDAGAAYGYRDYAYTAEHGVAWAAALARLLRPAGGRVLDIGCADGHLLAKLRSSYELYGIEVNETMGRIAAQRGVSIIGRDLLDPTLVSTHEGAFDVIVAVAVFEHLPDIRTGVEVALRLLAEDGVMIFEVPLISKQHDNQQWFRSSLEHFWYPSEEGLQRLFETELGVRLVGAEVHVRNYASTFVGIAYRELKEAGRIRGLAASIVTGHKAPASAEERIARMLLELIHAATATSEVVGFLAEFPPDELNRPLLRRLAELWQADLWRLEISKREAHQARQEAERAIAHARRLESDLAAVVSDRLLNQLQLTCGIANVEARLRKTDNDPAPLADREDVCHGERSAIESELRATPQSKNALHVPRRDPITDLWLLEDTGHRPPLCVGERDAWPDRPLVSVVIPSFNYGRFIAQAVDSVLAQTFQDLEVIVVEGGSSDPESRRVVAQLERPRTRVLLQSERHRAGANRNLGISQARGKYICCLDADDLLRATYIEKAVFLLERHGYDVVSCGLELFGDRSEIVHTLERPDLETLLRENQVLTCAVFRRELWERSGGFRDVTVTENGHVHEDWAFWVRLGAMGARFINMARDPLLLYRFHRSSLSQGKDVLPMDRQRELIRKMNEDLINVSALAESRRRANVRSGTPSVPLPEVRIDRPAEQSVARQPTLLLAMPFLILGGAERLLSGVVAHLVASGWRVVIVTSVETAPDLGDTTSWFEAHTKEIFHLPRFLPRDYWDDFLRHLVASRRIDILWIVGSAHAYDCLRKLRAEFIHLKVVDLLFNTVGHTANNRRRRDLIDLILVENQEVSRWLLERGEAPSRIQLIESGVDTVSLRPTVRSVELMRQIRASAEDFLVGFAGRWSEEKDPLGFVEIASRVDPSLPVRFIMSGAGNLRPEIERAIAEAQLPEDRFWLLGKLPDIIPMLASLDILVVPSRLDGRPQVVLEALALGVPVVASCIGALPDLIQDGETGWLCEPGNIEEFKSRILDALASRSGLADMRFKARAFAEARLDARPMFLKYQQALTALLPEDLRMKTTQASVDQVQDLCAPRDHAPELRNAASADRDWN